jgi:hypothetical protein
MPIASSQRPPVATCAGAPKGDLPLAYRALSAFRNGFEMLQGCQPFGSGFGTVSTRRYPAIRFGIVSTH